MRVIVVDDDKIVVRSLATILDAEPDVDVVGTGTSGHEAVSLFTRVEPDVVLMDIQMTDGDGLTAAEEILGMVPAARIVFLTTFSDDEYIVRARDESALKGLSAREVDVVRAIADGMTNAEVAATLFMSEGTVRNHISSILAKLGLRNRTQIAVFYLRKCM